MSNTAATYLVAGICGAGAFAAYVWFIAMPAWSAYTKTWERLAACFMSLYAFLALLGIGAAGGAAIAYYWDRIAA